MKKYLLVFAGIATLIALAIALTAVLPPPADFYLLYTANLGVIHRVPIYDTPALGALALAQTPEMARAHTLYPYPYPPWYPLATFYLGFFPMNLAATLWFELNLVMLFIATRLLTEKWPPLLRLVAFPLALLFLPVIGTLAVGQCDFPVLLGVALLISALRKENVPLTALGAALLTFKPHIGGLILLATLVYLFARRDPFAGRAFRAILLAGFFLALAGFIADPAWPVTYPGALFNYQDAKHITTCSECANLPIFASRWFFDGSLKQAAIIAVALLMVFSVLFLRFYAILVKSPEVCLTAALLVTLLVSPYLYNYDFMLLLIPLGLLLKTRRGFFVNLALGLCYVIPTVALALLGRDGNPSLLLATLTLAILLGLETWQKSRTGRVESTPSGAGPG
jgi:hypothetical protein